MKPTIKRKWVDALRSYKYKQGPHRLYENRRHCCLGVLARIQGAKVSRGVLRIGGEDVRPRNAAQYLASPFACGLHRATQAKLASMNDGGKTFPEIADYIEKNL
jgi:hypothetical protein